MRKNPSSLMAVLAILMLILAACNGGGESPSASEAASESAAESVAAVRERGGLSRLQGLHGQRRRRH